MHNISLWVYIYYTYTHKITNIHTDDTEQPTTTFKPTTDLPVIGRDPIATLPGNPYSYVALNFYFFQSYLVFHQLYFPTPSYSYSYLYSHWKSSSIMSHCLPVPFPPLLLISRYLGDPADPAYDPAPTPTPAEPVEEPIEEPVEGPIDSPVEVDEPVDAPVGSPVDSPTEPVAPEGMYFSYHSTKN